MSWRSCFAFFLSISVSSWLQAADLESCQINGAFRSAIYDAIGKTTALSKTSFGLNIINVETGDILCREYVKGDQVVYPASSIKTLIALAALRMIDSGELALSEIFEISQPNADVECDPTNKRNWGCSTYSRGKHRTLLQLIEDTIIYSNNISTNQLIDIASKDFINATADLLRASGLKVYRKVYSNVEAEPDIKTPNEGTARGMTQMYREIVSGKLQILSEDSRLKLIDILERQSINSSLNQFFPKTIPFYHKTGNTSTSTSDAGFYFIGENTAVIVAGLQNFYKKETLQQIGKKTLDFTLGLEP